jgi:hypothetical protein
VSSMSPQVKRFILQHAVRIRRALSCGNTGLAQIVPEICPCEFAKPAMGRRRARALAGDSNAAVLFADKYAGNCLTRVALLRWAGVHVSSRARVENSRRTRIWRAEIRAVVAATHESKAKDPTRR